MPEARETIANLSASIAFRMTRLHGVCFRQWLIAAVERSAFKNA